MIKRNTYLKRGNKPIRSRSTTNSTRPAYEEYQKVTAPAWMLANPNCFICDTQYNCAPHHRAGRGKFLNDTRYLRTLCFHCHRKVHDEPACATAEGHILRIYSVE